MAETEAPGCRDAAFATAFLLGLGMALFASGLALINQSGGCTDTCEFIGLGILYSGGPISAALGAFTNSVVIAWPLEVMLWVVLGFWAARRSAVTGRSLWAYATAILVVSLIYGFTLSQFVELAV